MNLKTELLNNLERIKKNYEDSGDLGEYAKGRYSNTKMIIDIVKKMNFTPCCTSLKCEGCKKPLNSGLCSSCCSDLASCMY